MFVASVHYPRASGEREHVFDFDYYLNEHVPLARRLLGPVGLVRLEVERGVSGEEPGTRPRWVCVARLLFPTAAAFYEAMACHGDELARDVPRYTDAELEIQVTEILDA